jgi:deazaflavin-dependent oxidoreductase (nitroreductase family)
MAGFAKTPKFLLKLIHLPPRFLYAIGLGRLAGRFILLLTTTGRKSGLPRVTPLQYEQDGEVFYVASARGIQADWFRNVQANPQVQVQVGERYLCGVAEAVTNPQRIADFLALRLKRHPLMIGMLMRLEGLPLRYTRQDLERFAAQKAMVVIRPLPENPEL